MQTGDGTRAVYDEFQLAVTVDWPGGSYDGWDYDSMIELARRAAPAKGTLILFR